MLTTLDYVILVGYILGVAALGILAGGRQRSTADYFLGGRNLPWWAVCFSIVATETSTLTVIGIPAVAYVGSLTFFQLTFGYLLGRVLVSMFFLPRYFAGELSTAYAFLGQRYGDGMRTVASVTFLVTRLLADGVRLFATAIPLKVIADMAGVSVTYFEIIVGIALVTIVYTYVGGIKAVVWMDVIQMGLYLGGALLALFFLLRVPGDPWAMAVNAGKVHWLDTGFSEGLSYILTQPYTLVTAVVGGAVFSMASHGTDQLIVQRLLTCRTVRDAQKALVGSAVVVMFQFALFLGVGLLLWAYYRGAPVAVMGLSRADEVFPRYIIEGLPAGLSGLLLAGILAAAMSTLSSSLNALASSTMMDLYERLVGKRGTEAGALRLSRLMTLLWGLVFILFAGLFQDRDNPVVELGLAIASFTYGGLLGAFLLGLLARHTRQRDALVAYLAAMVVLVCIIFGLWYDPVHGWQWLFNPSESVVREMGLKQLAWPWYTVVGAGISLFVGSLLGLRHR